MEFDDKDCEVWLYLNFPQRIHPLELNRFPKEQLHRCCNTWFVGTIENGYITNVVGIVATKENSFSEEIIWV